MLRLLILIFMIVSPAVASEVLSIENLPQIARFNVYTPGGPGQIGPGANPFGPGSSSYVQPTLTNNYSAMFGDSRTADNFSVLWSSPTFTDGIVFGVGYPAWIPILSNNKILYTSGSGYGIGARTSAGEAASIFISAFYCNDATSVSLSSSCFQGSYLKAAASVSAGATTLTTTWQSGPVPVVGYYINTNNFTNQLCQITGVSGTSPNYTLTVANIIYSNNNAFIAQTGGVVENCITTTIPINTAITLSPPSQTNAIGAFTSSLLPGLGAKSTDIDTGKLGGGQFFGLSTSLATDPSGVVYFLGNINDGNIASVQSISNDMYILNQLGPNGTGSPNKIIIAADEYPIGLATGYSRSNAFNGAMEIDQTVGTTVTLGNAAYYYDTQQVIYLPSGSGPPFLAGTNDGVNLTYCATGQQYQTNTQTGCSQASLTAGQYSISPSGVLSVSTADSGVRLGVYYRSNGGLGLLGSDAQYVQTIHDWLSSSSSSGSSCSTSWTGSTSGSAISSPGANCPNIFPHVHVAPTWVALFDTSTGSSQTTFYPKPYTLVDGLHPAPYGGALIAKAMYNTALAAGAVPATSPYTPPTVNNPLFYSSSSSLTTAATTTCSANSARANSLKLNYFLSGISVGGVSLTTIGQSAANSMFNGAALYFPTTTSGITPGTTVTCVDATNNLLQLSSPATTTVNWSSGASLVQAQMDPNNILGNGVFSSTYGKTLSFTVTNCSTLTNCPAPANATQALPITPSSVAYLTLDAASGTAITAGTLGFNFGMENNPDGSGYDNMVFVLQGTAGTTAGNATLTLGPNTGVRNSIVQNNQYRGICQVLISAGPNGHLTGLNGTAVKLIMNTTGTFTPPGVSTSTYNSWVSFQGGGSTSFSDASIFSGSPGVTSVTFNGVATNTIIMNSLTPPVIIAGAVPVTTANIYLVIGWNANDPVSATVRLRRCGIIPSTM